MKLTKTEFEEYLNETTSPRDSFWMGGKFRTNYYNANKYGTALRKYDPIAFQVAYNDWKNEELFRREKYK